MNLLRRSFILIFCFLTIGGLAQIQQEYWVRWNGEWTLPQQREIILWFTRHYGVSIGAKCVLESSGGQRLDHGEDSYGYLGLSMPEARKRRLGIPDDVLRDLLETNRHFQGQLAKEIDDENRDNMRFKKNQRLCTAMVYPGWRNWNNPQRLNRGLVDLQWQDYLKGIINESK